MHRDIVAVGASAGGVEALRALVAGLPADFSGALLVVLHVPRDAPSALPAILSRSGPLTASTAVDGAELVPGCIYVAPTDHHMLLLDGRIRLTRGPAENGHRPAVDPLFRSVARAAGRRSIGVVLSGSRDDGAAGLASIVAHGGAAVVQEPSDALYPWMPKAALARTPGAYVAAAADLGGMLDRLTTVELSGPTAVAVDDDTLTAEVAISSLEPLTTDELAEPAAGYGCPACGGALFQIGTESAPRYRCRVGHAWSPESLLDEQAIALEGALWMALRALEEKSALSRRMARSRTPRHNATGARFHDMAADAEAAGETIRRLISQLGSTATPPERAESTTASPGCGSVAGQVAPYPGRLDGID
ncbi:two-component system chemotaxis response regulator CheB [Krasilnikovia cinnamomea]|uniref:protein-glutamate methylesterase n=1 Tax=Krasilnikovia cinnamomea TaxID=349313 RepID=A0A4Q7ZT71_9ACTN|nr:two-component system chemotaxis response regulator CheB [Krasilnikovia cinnamomea]